jgi:hypothetical protein
LDAVPFPFPASVFMFPKGTIRHPSEGECPYIVVSRVAKGQVFPLPLKDVTFTTTAADNSIVVSTYLPDECRSYHKSINGGYTRHAAIRPKKPTPSAGRFPFSVLAVAIS